MASRTAVLAILPIALLLSSPRLLAQELPRPLPPDSAPEERKPAADGEFAISGDTKTTPSDVFRWNSTSSAEWTSGGFTWTVDQNGEWLSQRPAVALPAGSDWLFKARLSRAGPAGFRFTAMAGARRGQTLPSFMTDIIGSDRTITLVGTQLIDPSERQTTWDAGVGIERPFDLGPVEVRVIGDAIASFGRSLERVNAITSPGQATPQKLTGGAARVGLAVRF